MISNVSVVINYSSADHKFLFECINECLEFSEDIVITSTTHSYKGFLEDKSKFESGIMTYIKNPYTYFHLYNYSPEMSNKNWKYWHNNARLEGWKQTDKQHNDYTLFIDVSEIPEGENFLQWIKNDLYDADYFMFTEYLYYNSVKTQVVNPSIAPILIRNKVFDKEDFKNNDMYEYLPKNKYGKEIEDIMFHNYKYVRTQEELFEKIKFDGIKYLEDIEKSKESEHKRIKEPFKRFKNE